MIVSLNNIKYFHDVRMIQTLENPDFPPYRFFPRILFDFGLFVGLDGNFLILGLKDGNSDQCICSLPDHFSHHIILLKFQG
jgi:hypothetical protein